MHDAGHTHRDADGTGRDATLAAVDDWDDGLDRRPGRRAAAIMVGTGVLLGLWVAVVETVIEGPPRSWLSPVYLTTVFGLLGLAWVISERLSPRRPTDPLTLAERRVDWCVTAWVFFWVSTGIGAGQSSYLVPALAVVPAAVGGRWLRRRLTARWVDETSTRPERRTVEN